MDNEYANGYKVIQAVCFDDGNGVAIGKDEEAPFPLTTWQFTEKDDIKIYFSGYYFRLDEKDTAQLDYEKRIIKYASDNPGVQEKYNYLAAAEISGEDNYNQIDDVLNNASKPTFEERMKDAKDKANKHNSRKSERHKDERHSKKSDRLKSDRHKKE
jgi:hypothetical protein